MVRSSVDQSRGSKVALLSRRGVSTSAVGLFGYRNRSSEAKGIPFDLGSCFGLEGILLWIRNSPSFGLPFMRCNHCFFLYTPALEMAVVSFTRGKCQCLFVCHSCFLLYVSRFEYWARRALTPWPRESCQNGSVCSAVGYRRLAEPKDVCPWADLVWNQQPGPLEHHLHMVLAQAVLCHPTQRNPDDDTWPHDSTESRGDNATVCKAGQERSEEVRQGLGLSDAG
mmetsp:Transcript_36833/g.92561  ORF Transcript_36833/g.92561 Transcript_36833/m.92561 type:complete len:225 (+) Transcript_36833:40-714(+)